MKKIFSLTKDVRSLYFSTGKKEIENLFLKLANISVQEVEHWFSSDHNIKQIYNKVKDKGIINALMFLRELKKQYPAGMDFPTFSLNVLFNPKFIGVSEYLFIFVGLSSMFDILAPYQNFLSLVGKLQSSGASRVSSSSVSDDLSTIQNEIEKESLETKEDVGDLRLSKKNQIDIAKVEMYTYLFKRFSAELAKEANERGLKPLGDALSNGLLDSPFDLSKVASIRSPMKHEDAKAMAIIKVIIKNYGAENSQKNYEYLKAEVLEDKGLLPFNDPLSRSQRDSLKFNFILNPEKKDEWIKQKQNSSIHKNSLFLQSESLTFLSTIFALYHAEVTKIARFIPDEALDSIQ